MTLTYLPAALGRSYAPVELRLRHVECLVAALDYDGTGVDITAEETFRAESARDLEDLGDACIGHLVLSRRSEPRADLTVTRTGVTFAVDETGDAPAALYRAERAICGVLEAAKAPPLSTWRFKCHRRLTRLYVGAVAAVVPVGALTVVASMQQAPSPAMWALFAVWCLLAFAIMVTHYAVKLPLPAPVQIGASPTLRPWRLRRLIEEVDMVVTAVSVVSPAALWFWHLFT